MIRSVAAVVLFLLASISGAAAACGPPVPLVNGTNADATQVNTNFKDVFDCVRDKLSANRTYYVQTTPNGNDSFCTGLTNAAYVSGAFPQNCAFATLQKAYSNITAKLDLGGFTVTVQIGDGTYTGGLSVTQPWSGGGAVTFQGNSGTPANVVISTTNANAIGTTGSLPGTLTIKDMKLQTTASGDAISHQAVGLVQFANINFGPVAIAHLDAVGSGVNLECTGNYTISGGGFAHVIASRPSNVSIRNKTITLTGTPTFTASFALAANAGSISIDGITFVGSAAGSKYSAQTGGLIGTGTGNINYLPGSTPGAGTNYGVAPFGLYQ